MSDVFSPDSIVVIGASADSDRISGLPVEYLLKHDYEGDIYPVNPNHDTINGLKCYSDVTELPEIPDFAMILLPARLVVDVVEDCLESGIGTVLIISSGFAETRETDAVAAEDRLARLADEYDANVIGPNSQGLINFPKNVTASFTPALRRDELLTGPVSFVTQSGAFGGALTTLLQEEKIGLNKWVATGNEADLESLDFISMLAEDETTEVAAGYLEGFEDGRKLIEMKRTDAGIDLPILALKVGRSERGKTAAASHTGKIAGSHQVYESVFTETGVIGVNDIDLFISIARTIPQLERSPGLRIGVVTTSGGAGIHITDVATNAGLELPELSGSVREQIEEHIPSYGSAFNPVDMTAQVASNPEAFKECLRALLEADFLDSVVLQITNASGEGAVEYADTVAGVANQLETPLFVVWTGGIDKEDGLERYREASIPVFENPARCIRTIAAIGDAMEARSRLREAKSLPARTPSHDGSDHGSLTETAGKELLAEYGIQIPHEHLITSADDAVAAAEPIGYPVVAKLVSPDLQHRNRVNGVRTDLETSAEVDDAYDALVTIAEEEGVDLEGISIQEQVAEGIELGIGIVTETDFGPVVMLGRGGVDIEQVEDVAFRTIPTSSGQVHSMLDELETVSTSDFSEAQLDSIVSAITGLSELYMDNPWIQEADVNPIIVNQAGAVAVDALFLGQDAESF